jgi:hypothetical protein
MVRFTSLKAASDFCCKLPRSMKWELVSLDIESGFCVGVVLL